MPLSNHQFPVLLYEVLQVYLDKLVLVTASYFLSWPQHIVTYIAHTAGVSLLGFSRNMLDAEDLIYIYILQELPFICLDTRDFP